MSDPTTPVLVAGTTCWRICRANRVTVIIDAAAYFAAAKAAILNAQRSVLLIGWDFDTRIQLEPDRPASDIPDELGAFLRYIVQRRPAIRVRVLRWDLSTLKRPFRGRMPLFVNWRTNGRLRVHLDHGGPLGAARHQKILVVDDSIAFCGGIDMTTDRWDTPAHSDESPYRIRPSGEPYGPWHDATTAVDGDAARALGELAREWWRRATGEAIEPPPQCDPCWPDGLEATFRDVTVGIARTEPDGEDRRRVTEIEEFYLAAIRSAERSIYIETQYFASNEIARALCERLKEKEGPEVVIINPKTAEGWLEEEVMGSARALLVQELRSADCWNRFGIFTPVTERGADIYVHAKVMTIDDRLLRVGSSNMNNRSLGLDTECDLAIEARPGEAQFDEVRDGIRQVRDVLLSEHLGVSIEQLQDAISERGSLLGAITSLSRIKGRSLIALEPPELTEVEEQLARTRLLDPQTPEEISALAKRGRVPAAALIALGVGAASALLFGVKRLRTMVTRN